MGQEPHLPDLIATDHADDGPADEIEIGFARFDSAMRGALLAWQANTPDPGRIRAVDAVSLFLNPSLPHESIHPRVTLDDYLYSAATNLFFASMCYLMDQEAQLLLDAATLFGKYCEGDRTPGLFAEFRKLYALSFRVHVKLIEAVAANRAREVQPDQHKHDGDCSAGLADRDEKPVPADQLATRKGLTDSSNLSPPLPGENQGDAGIGAVDQGAGLDGQAVVDDPDPDALMAHAEDELQALLKTRTGERGDSLQTPLLEAMWRRKKRALVDVFREIYGQEANLNRHGVNRLRKLCCRLNDRAAPFGLTYSVTQREVRKTHLHDAGGTDAVQTKATPPGRVKRRPKRRAKRGPKRGPRAA